MDESVRTSPLAGLALAMLAVSPHAHALKADGQAGVDLTYTSNAALTASNEQSDIIARGRLAGSLREDDGPVRGNVNASVQQLDYLDNTFGGQTYLQLGANGIWEPLQNRFIVNVSDYFNQTSVNNLSPSTPGNTQDVNAFNLSATATLPVAARHTVSITPVFSDFRFETSASDNQQTGVRGNWRYRFRPTTVISLNGGHTDVDFDDDTGNPDHERQNANLGIQITRARSRYEAHIGVTRVERDTGGDTDGTSALLRAEYDFTGKSKFIVHASSDITDSSNAFLSSSIDPTTGAFSNVQVTNDVVQNDILRLTYQRTDQVKGASVWTELRKLDYEKTPFDRDVQEVGASLSYGFSARLGATVSGIFNRTSTDTPRTDKTWSLQGRIDYGLSSKLQANAGVQAQSRDSTGMSQDYDEYGVFAGLAYTFR